VSASDQPRPRQGMGQFINPKGFAEKVAAADKAVSI
jgi:hypothetical protein